MRRLLIATLLLAGCDRLFGLNHLSVNESDVDGAVDGASGGDDGMSSGNVCFGTGLGFRAPFCFSKATVDQFPALPALTAVVDTNATCPISVAQGSGEPVVCVFAAENITIQSTVRFTGPHPVVLLAKGTVAVAGILDVASYSAVTAAGAGALPCVSSALGGGSATGTNGGGGGAGGTFVGSGGSGGGGSSTGGIGALGGTAVGTTGNPTFIRGGCDGGKAGNAVTGSGSVGGHGGGAVYLVAGASVLVNGGIYAFGAGGRGGAAAYIGGAGAGAGGMIVLDAPSVTLSMAATLNARGGSGGEGGSDTSGGNTGADGAATAPVSAGTGGDGGAGDDLSASAGTPGLPGGGGGGGGGGGYVGIFSPSHAEQTTNIHPPADIH